MISIDYRKILTKNFLGIGRRLRTASKGWADLREGTVIAFRCGLISGLHHQLEVIGPDRASRDFPAFDANFPGFCRHAFLANSC